MEAVDLGEFLGRHNPSHALTSAFMAIPRWRELVQVVADYGMRLPLHLSIAMSAAVTIVLKLLILNRCTILQGFGCVVRLVLDHCSAGCIGKVELRPEKCKCEDESTNESATMDRLFTCYCSSSRTRPSAAQSRID